MLVSYRYSAGRRCNMSALKATSRVERGGPASGATAMAEQVGNAVRGAA